MRGGCGGGMRRLGRGRGVDGCEESISIVKVVLFFDGSTNLGRYLRRCVSYRNVSWSLQSLQVSLRMMSDVTAHIYTPQSVCPTLSSPER
jgi:hypothetical protein